MLSLSMALCCPASAQDTLQTHHLESTAYSFSLKEGVFSGAGATVMDHYLGDAQFILIGEMHQSAQLGHFTKALLPRIGKLGFRYLAVESGPETAKKLMNYSNPPAATVASLKKLNEKYGSRLFQRVPFIFFHGIEDAGILEEAGSQQFMLWGLDQEFIYSYRYWFDQLRDLIEVEEKQTMRLFRQCRNRIKQLYFQKIFRPGLPINCLLLNDSTMQTFFRTFRSGNTEAQHIITALRDSWNIYCLNNQGMYDSSNQQRATYMQRNFATQYGQAVNKGEALPKVILKLGNVHTTRQKSPMGVSDIGSFIHELAARNNTRVASFRFLRRYYGKGSPKDLSKEKDWASYHPLLRLGSKTEWMLVDLRPAREKIRNGQLLTNKRLRYEIENYDFVLLAPADRRVTPNF
jgi:hypothetical protein